MINYSGVHMNSCSRLNSRWHFWGNIIARIRISFINIGWQISLEVYLWGCSNICLKPKFWAYIQSFSCWYLFVQKKSSVYHVYCIYSNAFHTYFNNEANTMSPDQTSPDLSPYCLKYKPSKAKYISRCRQQLWWIAGKGLISFSNSNEKVQ